MRWAGANEGKDARDWERIRAALQEAQRTARKRRRLDWLVYGVLDLGHFAINIRNEGEPITSVQQSEEDWCP